MVHVLVDCPELRQLRQQLREKVGDALNSVAEMLGGRVQNDHGKPKRWAANREVLNAVIEFAEMCQRFRSRETERPLHRGRW